MAKVELFFRVDDIEETIFVELAGVTEEEVRAMGVRIKSRIIELIHERSDIETPDGLASSIRGEFDPDTDDGFNAIILSDNEAALMVEEGTGLFGPKKSYIFPRNRKFMVFHHRGLGQKVFAQRVAGQPGKHMFRDAMNDAKI
jgi:hypothetical protein